MGIYGIIFAVPVFVQDYLQFSAYQSGLLQMPAAIASALTMMAMSKIAGRFDARAIIGVGALTTVAAAFAFAHINPDTGVNSLYWPLMLRAIGSVCMFLPLSLATLGSLPRDKVAAGAGFYNLTRQLGSSIGIALITTILAHRETVHRAGLVEKISAYRPATLARLELYNGVMAHHSANAAGTRLQAFQLIDTIVNSQALLLSFADVFRYVGLAFLLSLPLLLQLGQGRTSRGVAAAAH
jgi:DHA2 family multidrug resistance protein